jgi:hypothetical protein
LAFHAIAFPLEFLEAKAGHAKIGLLERSDLVTWLSPPLNYFAVGLLEHEKLLLAFEVT